ncbi:tyrosine-type recombinase/integrase [Isoptericola sediminis]|uniref:Site-specific integrase n=1 Tax=Isoptericola sediminis TaxID=2733572 RepID=A0A849K141_9MICO|nr:tyrosine-type recombinase/integrase [Isoptericola sediminis]NNU28464.1 site-specific integrase [Isoptericola sediminis]
MAKTSGVYQRHRKTCDRTKTRCDCPWSYLIETPAAAGGKRRQFTKSGFASKTEAKRAREEALVEHRAGRVDVDRKITVTDYLNRWIDGKEAAGSVRPSTVRGYRDVIGKFVAPHIGNVRLVDMTPGHLDRMYSAIRRERPDVTPSTIRRIHATLRSAFRSAVKRGEMKHDVTAHVELPAHRRPRVTPWEPAEYAAFIGSDVVRSHRLRPVFILAAMGGLRRGELAALQWDDVDLDRAVLVVRRQATQVGDTISITAPKTAAGTDRVVDLDQQTVSVLREHRAAQARERLKFGPAYEDNGLVFAREDGAMYRPDHLAKTFTRLIARVSVDGEPLRRVRFHDLRHLQASLMLAAGVPMAVVSKRLGHSNVAVTSDTYSHLLGGVGASAAEAAAALIPTGSEGRP